MTLLLFYIEEAVFQIQTVFLFAEAWVMYAHIHVHTHTRAHTREMHSGVRVHATQLHYALKQLCCSLTIKFHIYHYLSFERIILTTMNYMEFCSIVVVFQFTDETNN